MHNDKSVKNPVLPWAIVCAAKDATRAFSLATSPREIFPSPRCNLPVRNQRMGPPSRAVSGNPQPTSCRRSNSWQATIRYCAPASVRRIVGHGWCAATRHRPFPVPKQEPGATRRQPKQVGPWRTSLRRYAKQKSHPFLCC